ncbi:sigma-70 family RNA polymerase sigma factor [Muricauda sp. 2012CJ35-5]|uniref:RNA polymerase sigma factor n=1 Tax=Flagellimonas spongiicola TaxID=2942208 RepID=A0ABT0PW97_9FLAO|nr:sigma-70 family RNA polymerase sigma factor [Allomuricauda spongiicola]MCL6275652.1 sigma-70 family RNA polymerase sigma factor [Allomuricauda spongiicola]
MEQTTDQLDIEAIINGDSQAFAMLVDQYKNLVFTVALRTLKNREEAEEVAQDTFIKVFKSLNGFKGDAKLSSWIYRIAYNTCLDRLKKHKKEIYDSPIEEINEVQVADMQNALDAMIQDERRNMIKKCIALLSPVDAALLTLFYFEENNLNEMAKTLNMSANTAKVKLFRARTRLGHILKEQLKPETMKSYGIG